MLKKKYQTTSQLDFNLFNVLACPQCHKSLEMRSAASKRGKELVCSSCACAKRYPIKNNVPYFVRSVHTPEFKSQYESTDSLIKKKLGDRAHRALWRLYKDPLFRTAKSRDLISKQLPELLASDSIILNLGSGQFDKDSALFQRYANRIINLDIVPFGNVHIVADAHLLPFPDSSLDLVYMSCVLEHVRDASVIVKECNRILKDGGYLYTTTPFISRHHSDSDYRRWTLMGLDYLFQDFEKIASGIHCGPASAMALALREFLPLFFGSGYINFLVKLVMGWLLTPLAYFDLFLNRNRLAYKLAESYYYLGQKRVKKK